MSQPRFACFLALLLAPALGFSSSPLPTHRALNFGAMPVTSLPVYVSAFIDRQSIGISDSRFTMPAVTVAAGWWGWPGIGLELELGKSIGDDSLNNLDLAVHSTASLNLRLESPAIDRVAAYAVFGLSRSNFDSAFNGEVVNAKKNSLRGMHSAFGLTIKWTQQLALDTAFSHHEYDDDIGINGFRIGLRYDFSKGGR